MIVVTVLYVVCFACRGTGKEPDHFGERVCIWCSGSGRRRAKRGHEEESIGTPKA